MSAGRLSVRIVATSNPPIIAKAIGPQNTVGAIGIMPSTVDTAVSMIGRKRELLASTAAVPDPFALRPFGIDLTDQDHGILGDHPQQRQNAENGDEAQRPVRIAAAPHDADQAERRHAEDQNSRWKLCSCTMRTVSMISSITGTTAMTEACDF